MMLNFITFIICTAAAIYQGYLGNIGWVLVESGFALMNLPYAIKWLKLVIHLKEVKVICHNCGSILIYENWFNWVWHTPFHWFGKRKGKCSVCGEWSYMTRLK